MIKVQRHKLKPTKEQVEYLLRQMGALRFVYNQGVARYRKDPTTKFSVYTIGFKALKDAGEHEWLKQTPSVFISKMERYDFNKAKMDQQKANRQRAKQKKRIRQLKFKKRGEGFSSLRWDVPIKISSMFVWVPGCSPIRYKQSGWESSIPKEWIKLLSISYDGIDFWLNITHEDGQVLPDKVTGLNIIGIDQGIKTMLTCSNGNTYDLKETIEKNEKKIAELQKIASFKQKGSKNHQDIMLKIRKLHRKGVRQKADLIYSIASDLTKNYDGVALETLCRRGWQKEFGRQIGRMGLFKLETVLKQKCAEKGKHFIKVEKFFPSSKMCSQCGNVKKKLARGERIYRCECCGLEIDRDLNAAINIKDRALVLLSESNTDIAVVPNG